jgi:hypothetical protein
MTWPQKMDALGALIHSLLEDYAHLSGFKGTASPLLTKAQIGRNKIIHAFWGLDETGQVTALRATARGKLKFTQEAISLQDIESIVADVSKAGAALLRLILAK